MMAHLWMAQSSVLLLLLLDVVVFLFLPPATRQKQTGKLNDRGPAQGGNDADDDDDVSGLIT